MDEKKTSQETDDEKGRGQKKGDNPPPGKVEAKRQEQAGKTFQSGIEKKG